MTLSISLGPLFTAAASRSLENWVTTWGDLVKRTEEDAETESGNVQPTRRLSKSSNLIGY